MKRILAAGFAIVLVAGCDGVAQTPIPSSTAGAAVTAPPSAPSATAPAPSVIPVATPAGPSATLAAGATWQRIGVVTDGALRGAFVVGGRYLAYGRDAQEVSRVWSSATGAEWQPTQIPTRDLACPAAGSVVDSSVEFGATNGEQVLLVGSEYRQDGEQCDWTRGASWVTDDGLTWQRGPGFGGDSPYDHPAGTWVTDGGWEALVRTGGDDPLAVWRSSDGLSWSSAGRLGLSDPLDATITGAPDGTRVMVVTNNADGSEDEVFGLRGGESRLRWSRDGVTWKDIAFDFNAVHGPTRLFVLAELAPATDNAWVVVGSRGDEGPADIWRSTDLVNWQQGAFPKASVTDFAWTRYGYIATGSNVGCGDGGVCPPNPTEQFISPDGLTWTPLGLDLDSYHILDGPGGVLAIDGNSVVWALR